MADCRYRRRPDVMFTIVSGEVLALDVEGGNCFGMDPVASEVWNLLAEPHTTDELCTALLARFNVEPEQCREETAALIEHFRNEGLIDAQPVS